MKVKTLIAELSKADPELDVCIPAKRPGFVSFVQRIRTHDLRLGEIRPENKRVMLLEA